MRNKGLTVTLAVVIMVLSGLLLTRMGSEFVPSLNEGDIALHALRIPGTSLTTAIEMQDELEKTIKTFAEVERVFQDWHRRDSDRSDAAKCCGHLCHS